MKNLVKLKVILLAFTTILTTQSFAADRILPLPKPTVDQETKAKIEKNSMINVKLKKKMDWNREKERFFRKSS